MTQVLAYRSTTSGDHAQAAIFVSSNNDENGLDYWRGILTSTGKLQISKNMTLSLESGSLGLRTRA
jgi:hypothetical protein